VLSFRILIYDILWAAHRVADRRRSHIRQLALLELIFKRALHEVEDAPDQ
jgi:hypothetical protein